jgi:hypothetical protein
MVLYFQGRRRWAAKVRARSEPARRAPRVWFGVVYLWRFRGARARAGGAPCAAEYGLAWCIYGVFEAHARGLEARRAPLLLLLLVLTTRGVRAPDIYGSLFSRAAPLGREGASA